jgi:hypothetical protein
MIDVFKALAWLNAIDNCSCLNNEDRQFLREIGKLGLFHVRIEPILERFRTAAHSSSDSLRKAEILLYCAAIGHSRGWHPQAARDARESVISYDLDDHRRAVALWILGITQWQMFQNHEAHRNWAEARRFFRRCQNPFQHSSNPKDWYEDRIWQMEVELVARPEEISNWLNCFEPSSLRPPTGQIVKRVREKTCQRIYPSIYVLMQDLQEASKWSERVYEKAEIYLEFGLATYQMGNSHFAIELLRKAVMSFYPGIGTYHKQMVARCMLGAVEWMHKASHNQAAADWLHCLDELEELREWADRDNFPEKEKWYAKRRDILRSALLEWLEPPTQVDSSNGHQEQNRPKPTSPPPNLGKTDLYQELLAKVQWDRAIADRLIEYEYKLAPTADRNELIRRAIEHLIRDNQ